MLSVRIGAKRQVDEEDLAFAQSLAQQATLALELARLAEQAKQTALAKEREEAARERAAELTKANEALRGCLDALAEVPELDEFLGQVMGAMTRQLGAASSVLRLRKFEQNVLTLDLVFQDGRVIQGRLRCNFHSTGVPEESFPASVLEDLLRIAQEAMSNAARHAKPTVISVSLRYDSPNLVLEVTDNGSGIANAEDAYREGFGLSNMQARAQNLGAHFEVRTAPGRGTSIVIRLPDAGGFGR